MLRVRSAPKAEVAAAQGLFCEVINDQLTRMQKRGMERSVAVQQVLHRIASASARPRDSDVRKLMKSKQVSRSYAERALIVKSEILRLKMEGFDTLSAIEEITKKVKLLDCKRIRSDGQRGGEATGGEAKRRRKRGHLGSPIAGGGAAHGTVVLGDSCAATPAAAAGATPSTAKPTAGAAVRSRKRRSGAAELIGGGSGGGSSGRSLSEAASGARAAGGGASPERNRPPKLARLDR
jgi:hypothetical protein